MTTAEEVEAVASELDLALEFFLYALLLGLAVFTASKVLQRRLSDSLVLFLLGVLSAVIAWNTEGGFAEFIQSAGQSHPHVILYLLLPPLLFSSSLNVHYPTFRKCFWQALLLAGPGVLITLFLVAPVVKLFGLGWSWPECFLLSAILSATDPVSVTSALEQLGAPAHLRVIIEGESLLNDGTAYVFFLLFKSLSVPDTTFDFGAALWLLIRLACGGVLWGYFCGVMSGILLIFCTHYPRIQTTLILGVVYMAFVLAETFLEVSGVLAVVTYGVYMSARGKYGLSPEGEGVTRHVFEHLEFWCNISIFPLAGVVVFNRVFEAGTHQSVGAWMLMLLLYVVVNVVRFVTLAGFFPLLQKTGKGLLKEEACIVGLAGLRGAVALSLCLAVHLDENLPEQHRTENNFFVSGVVCLTLLINGPVTAYFYSKFNLYPVHPFRAFTFERAVQGLEEIETPAFIAEIKATGTLFKTADWRFVHLLVPSYATAKLQGGKVVFPDTPPSIATVVTAELRTAFLDSSGRTGGLLDGEYAELKAVDSGLLTNNNNSSIISSSRIVVNDVDVETGVEGKMDTGVTTVATTTTAATAVGESVQWTDVWSGFKESMTSSLTPVEGHEGGARRVTVASEVLFTLIQCQYEHQFEHRLLAYNAMQPLINACNSGSEFGHDTHTDDANIDLRGALNSEYQQLLVDLNLPLSPLLGNTANNTQHMLRRPARWLLFARLVQAVECLSGYVRSHHELIESHHLHVHLAQSSFFVMKEYIKKAQLELRTLQNTFPTLYSLVQCLLTARATLFKKQNRLHMLLERGLLRERDGEQLVHTVRTRLNDVHSFLYHPTTAMRFL